MKSNFFYKTFVMFVLFHCSCYCGMNQKKGEVSPGKVRSAFALWASKKIRIQKIPFDTTLLDGKTLVDERYLKSKNIKSVKIWFSSTLLFDQTDRYLQKKFCRNIEFTTKDYYALGWNRSENYCSVIYDVRNGEKINSDCLEFIKPSEYFDLHDGMYEKNENASMQCGIVIGDELKNIKKAGICFFKDKKRDKNMFEFCNFLDRISVVYELSFLQKVTRTALNHDFTMIAAELADGRILLLSPIKIDNFRNFNSNYDMKFVYA